jgi:soluble P-type ATPase
MIQTDIPGFGTLQLTELVLDFNGTLACDGRLIAGVAGRLDRLAQTLRIHVVTADTFGSAGRAMTGLECDLAILGTCDQDIAKLNYVEKLGRERTVCIGNGRNDRLMLKAAALGIAVMQQEGIAAEALLSAQVVAPDIGAALDLLLHPRRLIATLRA